MPRRSVLAIAVAVALAGLLAACDTSASTVPSPADPEPVLTTPAVVADQAALDNRKLTVRGFFTTDGVRHLVCDAILESYPPQCGGAVIAVNGLIPDAIFAQLESSKDQPRLAQLAWGQVELRGLLHASPGGGRPTLELEAIRVVPG